MKKLNQNETLWFFILILFSTYLFYLLYTDKICLFVHPRMRKYILFSFMGFSVLAIFQFKKIFTKSHAHKIKKGYMLFLFPIILGGFVRPNGLNADLTGTKGVLKQFSTSPLSIKASQGKNIEKSKNSNLSSSTVELNEQNFTDQLNNIYSHMEEYRGKKITLQGFVYKEGNFTSMEFVLGRMVITCCAADAQVIGFLCDWKEAKQLSTDQWIRVTGTLDITHYKDQNVKEEEKLPIIKIDTLEKIEKPTEQYIYPSDFY